MKRLSAKKIATCGILSALALISFVLESLLPPLFVPGARLGVSNVFILICLIVLGGPYAFFALTVKTVIGSLITGNVSSILYSLPAGLISLSVELLLLKKCRFFSVLAVSTVGATINNLIQNVIFCLIAGVWEFMGYAPYLLLLGLIAGLFVGFIVYLTVRILPDSVYEKINQ